MERLPLELLQVIVKKVAYPRCNKSIRDLSSLRKVNQNFKHVTTPFLFESFPLWFGINSLQWLYNISLSSELSKCVRKIAFTPFCIESRGEDQQDIRRALIADNGFESVCDRFSDLELGRFIGARLKSSGEQSYLLEDVAQTALEHTFPWLENLEELEVLLDDREIVEQSLHKAYGVLTEKDYSFDAGLLFPRVIEAMNGSDVQLKRLCVYSASGNDPLNLMFNGGDSSTFKDLVAHEVPNNLDDYHTNTLATMETFTSSNLWKKALAHLQELALTLPSSFVRDRPIANICGALECVIKNASSHLTTIGLAGRGRRAINNAPIFDLLAEIELPQLKKIYLYCLRPTNIMPYEKLFAKHSKSLEHVHLWGIRYVGQVFRLSVWSKTLKRLRGYPWAHLRTFRVNIDTESDRYEELAPYLKGETDEHVWLSD